MAKKPTNKEIEDKCLENLNGFMKDFGIDSINFGSHSIKKTKGKKATPLKKIKNKKQDNELGYLLRYKRKLQRASGKSRG
jgi:hypothetical protein